MGNNTKLKNTIHNGSCLTRPESIQYKLIIEKIKLMIIALYPNITTVLTNG